MIINIDGLDIHYETEGEGTPMVFLHGWGGSTKSFQGLYNHYAHGFKVYNLDLPGFGESQEPKVAWDIEEYKNFLFAFFNELGIVEPIIIAHSFGCRIVIKAAKEIKYKQLIMTGAAGIKPKRKLGYYIKVYTFKLFKKLAKLPILKKRLRSLLESYRSKSGSSDYRQATEIMKGVLSKSVNEDLRNYLPAITCPTLLIWGEKDTATPLSDGQLMGKLIPDAGLIVFDGGSHFAYIEQIKRFITIVDHFVEGNRNK